MTNTANPAPAKIYIRDQDYTTADTVLFTTDEMVETVLIKEGDYQLGTETGPFVIQRQGGSKEPPQFAANSLLQLSQAKPEDDEEATVIVDPDSVIEIPGQEGGFVFVTTADNEQKLMPISQLSNFIQTTSASNQE